MQKFYLINLEKSLSLVSVAVVCRNVERLHWLSSVDSIMFSMEYYLLSFYCRSVRKSVYNRNYKL